MQRRTRNFSGRRGRSGLADLHFERQADGAIMLGGGGPSKDLAIIRSMLDHAQANKVHYALVDISIYMLMASVKLIHSSLVIEKRRGRLELCPLTWDFINLAGARPKLRRPGKNVAWFLPGGTIGNLNEHAFFHSIAQESEHGDLLIIGAETLGSVDLEADKAALIKKYKDPAFRGFLGTPLRAAWHDLNLQMSLDEALDNLKIAVVDGLRSRHSTVPGSATVEIAVDASGGEKILLLTSTRYTESYLSEAIEAYHFKHEVTVPSRKNKNYKGPFNSEVQRRDFGVEENLTRSSIAEYLSGTRVEFILDPLDLGIGHNREI
jgi:hypothetical protein